MWLRNEGDFFLSNTTKWINMKSEAFKISINGRECFIPADYFIIIGDFDLGIDLVSPKELVGREFEAISYDNVLNGFKLSEFSICGYDEEVRFSFPVIGNHILPVRVGKNIILLANKNIYTRLKKLSLSDFM